jgi:catechol 2,3-dioxygenase-like lactoylglutathione lyase family enzyme
MNGSLKVTKLLRVARNVAALERMAAFYTDVLGFEAVGPVSDDAVLARLLRVERMWVLRMRLGAQEIELSQCFPAGAAYPAEAGANASCFQHIALLTTDIQAAYGRVKQAGVAAISRDGPVRLPVSSGGVIAYKFRDPEGHPLEFLQFPEGAGKLSSGYDHSAISVSEWQASVAFYSQIGLALDTRQLNQGVEQDALDGLNEVAVDVVALNPPQQTPHVELLCYRTPKADAMVYAPADICADRLVFGTADRRPSVMRDPDGHVVLLVGR